MFSSVWVCTGEMSFPTGRNMLAGVSNSTGPSSHGGRYNLLTELCGLFDERSHQALARMHGAIGVGTRG